MIQLPTPWLHFRFQIRAAISGWIAAQLNADTRPCNLVQLLPRLREV